MTKTQHEESPAWKAAESEFSPPQTQTTCWTCGETIFADAEFVAQYKRVACSTCIKRYNEGQRFDEVDKVWRAPVRYADGGTPQDRAWRAICPAAYLETNESHAKFPKAIYQKSVRGWKFGPRGLILTGKTGVGKSRSMFLLLRQLVQIEGHTCRAFFCEQWSEFVAANCVGDEDAMVSRRELQAVDLLVFDDLFAERMTERAESLLLSTLDMRLREAKPVLITTMHTGQSVKFLDQTRGAAVLRRLRETCDVISFK